MVTGNETGSRDQSGLVPFAGSRFTPVASRPAVAPPLLFGVGMVAVQPSVARAQVGLSVDTALGRYQSLVVSVIAGLILALASVPVVTLPLR